MSRTFYFVLILLSIVSLVHGEGIYTIIGPGTIRSNDTYNIVVAIHETVGPNDIQVGIFSTKFNMTKVVQIQPKSTKNIEFQLPVLVRDEYYLNVKGISGISIENSTKLSFIEYQHIVFIQTDKATYKPNDLVQFRMIFLDENTHAAQLSKTISILIYDSANNRIEIINKVYPKNGVYSGKFQLSKHAILGIWKIEVYADDILLETNIFEVAEYKLPKYQIVVDTNKNVALADEVIRVTVSAKYTFGKSVKGKATITIQDFSEMKETHKTIMIDEKGHVEFNILEDLQYKDRKVILPIKLQVNVEFEETLTGNRENLTTEIILHKYNFLIEAINPLKTYVHEKWYNYTVAVKKLDGSPVRDKQNQLVLSLDDYDFFTQLNDSGMATFNFKLPKIGILVAVSCKYLNQRKLFGVIESINTDSTGGLQLNLNTISPQIGEELSIDVIWVESIDYFIYTLTVRGRIVMVEHVNVTDNKKLFTISFRPTFEMAPKVAIAVHYFYENNYRLEEKIIDIEKEFQNNLKIFSTIQEALPGDKIEFQISTETNSFVGLLGVDQSVLLLKTGNDLSKQNIFESLGMYETKTPIIHGRRHYPGKVSGLVILTNANYLYDRNSPRLYSNAFGWSDGDDFINNEIDDSDDPMRPRTMPRKQFQETWLFDEFENTKQAQFKFFKKVPDTITSWVITGFSISPKFGLAITEFPTIVKVFKPFFITMDLPFSVKQGEIISIPVLIFNYMNKTLDTEIIMDNTDKEYEFTEAADDYDDTPNDETKQHKRITIPSNGERTVGFMIRLKTFGVITMKVTALTALAGDSVQQSLKVEPEGIKQYQNHAFFVTLNDQREQQETITIDVPDNVVPHSEHVEISAIGDIVGLSIKNIENLIRLPIGYGEENMINFVPSILVLKYLQTTNLGEPNVTRNALNILRIGYQRELNYKHDDGSYSSYGKTDDSGSTWLTAFVLRYFQQATEFITIDQEVIMKALNFLATKQTVHGNFAEFGRLNNFPRFNEVALTAFVLLAFLENKNNSMKYANNIERGINFLLKDLDNTEDLQSLSIIALVLQKSQHPLANEVLTTLKGIAKRENGYTWWSPQNTTRQKVRASFQTNNADIEITAYIALALLEKEPTAEVLPIIKWLIRQRNSNGGFISTQDTIVGLQALVKFAEKTGLNHAGKMEIEYVCEGIDVHHSGTITLMPQNSMALMIHELPKDTRKVQFTAKGNSSSIVQVSYNYNTINSEVEPTFRLNISVVRQNTSSKKIIINICAELVPFRHSGEEQKINMIVIEVALPSGFTTSREKLEKLRDMKTVLFTETKSSDTIAIIYLHGLSAGHEKCILIESARIYEIANQRPVPVIIYDYYDRNRRAIEYYVVKTTLCEICARDECLVACRNSEEHDNSTTIASSNMNTSQTAQPWPESYDIKVSSCDHCQESECEVQCTRNIVRSSTTASSSTASFS